MDDAKIALRNQLKRMEALYRWSNKLMRALPIADAIEMVDARRRKANDDDSRTLSMILSFFWQVAGQDDKAERIVDEMIARLPDDVRFPIRKASLHLYGMNDPKTALEAINMALVRAHRTGFFRREALGVKARILLELKLGDELSRTLEEIMSLEMKPGIPDCGRERDFVDRAPCGMIAEDVLARYNIFCPRRDEH
jgi:hypothetical protein